MGWAWTSAVQQSLDGLVLCSEFASVSWLLGEVAAEDNNHIYACLRCLTHSSDAGQSTSLPARPNFVAEKSFIQTSIPKGVYCLGACVSLTSGNSKTAVLELVQSWSPELRVCTAIYFGTGELNVRGLVEVQDKFDRPNA